MFLYIKHGWIQGGREGQLACKQDVSVGSVRSNTLQGLHDFNVIAWGGKFAVISMSR